MTPEAELKRLRLPYAVTAGESALGAVTAACHAHRLRRVTSMLSGADLTGRHASSIQRFDRADLDRVAHAIRADPNRLAAGTFGSEAGLNVSIHGRGPLKRSDIELKRRRISPLSLTKAPYHRAAWLLRSLPYCPESLELLIDECPVCGPLLWDRARGVGACGKCGREVPPSSDPTLAHGLTEDYRICADLLSIVPEWRARGLRSLPPGLRGFPPADLVSLALRAAVDAESVSPARHARLLVRSSAAPDRATIVARGIGILRRWPASIREVLAERIDADAGSVEEYHRLVSRLRWIGNFLDRKGPGMAILHTAFPNLRRKGANRLATPEKRRSYTSSEVRYHLPANTDELVRLRTSGAVRFIEIPSRKQFRALYDAEDIDRVKATIETSSTFAETARRLRVPLYAVHQLVALGLLEECGCAAVRALRGRSATDASIEGLLARISARIVEGDIRPTVRAVDLLKAIGGEKPWGLLLARVLDGTVPLIHGPANGRPGMMRIIPPADLDALSEGLEQISGLAELDMVPTFDIGDLLGVKVNAVLPLLAAQGVAAVEVGRSFSAETGDVLALSCDTVFLTELAHRHRWSYRKCQERLKRAGIPRHRGGWCRKSIVASGMLPPLLR